ncbi:MAG TPA: hypothetical protein VJR89_17135, partial [Polyangiales bacterium]|nr:hypothetical protein [Polyangiales bacterium]
MQERRSDLPGMALASCSVLFYSIAVTRLLSVVLWYHFAFLSISVAMLGLGAAGAWRALWQASERSLARAWLAAGIAIPLSVLVILRVSWLPAIVLALLAPMFALGVALSTLLARASPGRIGVLYAADLLGSTLGAALVLPVLRWVPTPHALCCLGVLPLLALAVSGGWRRPAWIAGCAGIALLVVWGAPLAVQRSKLYAEQGATAPIFERWTESARITVFERPIFSPEPDVPWGWGYGDRFEPRAWQERWIDQDGSAGTPVERLRNDPRELGHLFFDVTSAGYSILHPERVCVIGAGGGRDIVTALAAGARQVDAVELNRGIYELMTGPLAEFSGSIYSRPGVRTVVSEGRSFLTQTEQRYDLLQISLVDSWAATAAGAFALSENYLYTVEAMQLYLSRLRPGGVVSISRWTDRVQPFEAARLILLAEEALRRNGASSPRDHLLLLRGSSIGTLLIGERPFDAGLRARAETVAAQYGFTRSWPPSGPPTIVAVAMSDGGESFTRAGLDLTPPVDDRPFFFQAQRVFQTSLDVEQAAPSDVNLQGVTLLRQLVIGLAVLALALFLAPLVLFGREARGP